MSQIKPIVIYQEPLGTLRECDFCNTQAVINLDLRRPADLYRGRVNGFAICRSHLMELTTAVVGATDKTLRISNADLRTDDSKKDKPKIIYFLLAVIWVILVLLNFQLWCLFC